jgi:hypothetical protein
MEDGSKLEATGSEYGLFAAYGKGIVVGVLFQSGRERSSSTVV